MVPPARVSIVLIALIGLIGGVPPTAPAEPPAGLTAEDAAAIVQNAKNAEGAKRLIEFLAGPSARLAILRSGLDPVRSRAAWSSVRRHPTLVGAGEAGHCGLA